MPYIRADTFLQPRRYGPATAQIRTCNRTDTDLQPGRYGRATGQIRTCNRTDTDLQPDRYGLATGQIRTYSWVDTDVHTCPDISSLTMFLYEFVHDRITQLLRLVESLARFRLLTLTDVADASQTVARGEIRSDPQGIL